MMMTTMITIRREKKHMPSQS